MADSFDPTCMNNGPVTRTGSTPEGSAGPGQSYGSSNPATTQADGTANERADGETKQAPPNSTPSGEKSQYPAIDRFSGEKT